MDNKQIRRINLALLIDAAGGIGPLAARAQASEKYLWQILNHYQGPKDRNPREVGDPLARKLESGMGKPVGWMDSLHPSNKTTPAGDVQDMITDFLTLSPDEQVEFRIYLKTRADIARAVAARKK